MKYNSSQKDKLMNILKNNLQLSREEIKLFLKISDSTYDKISSPKVNRDLPKKTQYFLETIFHTEDWDEIITKIEDNKVKIKKMIRCKMKISENENNEEYITKNMNLFHTIITNPKFDKIVKNIDDTHYIEKLLASEKFVDALLAMTRVTEFHMTGNKKILEKDDYLYLGFFSTLTNSQRYEKANNELIKAGKITEKKILEKIEDKELFIFSEREE